MKRFFILLLLGISTLPASSADLKDCIVAVKPQLHEGTRKTFNNVADYFEKKKEGDLAEIFRSFAEGGHGSGFIYVDSTGENYILTNRHVVDQAEKVLVEFNRDDGTIAGYPDCPVIYVDNDIDLAVLKFPLNTRVLKESFPLNTAALEDGQDIWAAGFPGLFGRPSWQLSKGIISNRKAFIPELIDTNISHLIQHSASIDPGNSGGPLLLKKNDVTPGYEVIGVNTWSVRNRQNTFFSIPSAMIQSVVEKAKKVLELGSDPEGLGRELESTCEILASELSSENTDWEAVRKYISYGFVATSGWDSFIEVLRTVPASEAAKWEEMFFAISPVETMRSAIFFKMMKKFHSGKSSSVAYADVAAADKDKFGGNNAIRTNFSMNGSPFEVQWKYEFGHWRILYLNLASAGGGSSSAALGTTNPPRPPAIINLVIPGYTQLQQQQTGLGALFLTTGILGAALFGGSETFNYFSWMSYTEAGNYDEAQIYSGSMDMARIGSIIGLALWLGSGIISAIVN